MPKGIPEGYHSITPHIVVQDAKKAIEFYVEALGAKELYRMAMPNGKIGHAELLIGNSRLMIGEEDRDWGALSARSIGGAPTILSLYTEDVDTLVKRFLKAGGKELRPLKDQFYGDRSGQYEDPEGYRWTLAQQIEEVSPEEMERRMASMS